MGCTPLHLALGRSKNSLADGVHHACEAVVKAVFKAWPDAIGVKDENGVVPLDVRVLPGIPAAASVRPPPPPLSNWGSAREY